MFAVSVRQESWPKGHSAGAKQAFGSTKRGETLYGHCTGAPVCAELSGGLDSSSIVCVADSIGRVLVDES